MFEGGKEETDRTFLYAPHRSHFLEDDEKFPQRRRVLCVVCILHTTRSKCQKQTRKSVDFVAKRKIYTTKRAKEGLK